MSRAAMDCGGAIALSPPSAAPDAESAPTAAHSAALAPEKPPRVLVIDDDRDVADSMSMLLQTFDVDCRVAYNGAAGIVAVAEFDPDLVFLDIGMPDMDGYETARRIRAAPHGRRLRLVALTGWGQDQDRRRSEDAGFDLHLTKPASLEALEELLSALG